ncbi:hypothetical protein KGF57_001958 [Candida theae]|uniref:Uncharacterized protein n=1 Tax=Candida theae TaxID=1198502 RepID=A0AAD5BG18_9ASCO|nr:uncharacterized protein KGF57_001958 [Candida theae]KAI5960014.1 hypothetical protein KGF57_001958 [Candida theae]
MTTNNYAATQQQQQQQPIRKSNRIRSLTAKASSTNNCSFLVPQTNTNTTPRMHNKRPGDQNSHKLHTTKRRKRSYIEEEEALHSKDKIDPVEKLLSLTSTNNDFLSVIESSSEEAKLQSQVQEQQSQQQLQQSQLPQPHPRYAYEPSKEEHEEEEEEEEEGSDIEEDEEEPIGIASVNFTEILNDNIRRYYRNKLQNQYKDSFALLNNSRVCDSLSRPPPPPPHSSHTSQSNSASTSSPSVPFFRSVNFGSPKKEYSVEDYLTYGDEEEERENELSGGHSPKSVPPTSSSSTSTATLSSLMALSDDEDQEDPHSQTVSPISSPSTTTSSLYSADDAKNNATTTTTTTTPTSSFNWQLKPKINFNYWRLRNNATYNGGCQNGFSFNGGDVSNALKQHSLYTATSEMVSTGNFMINDFYL